MSTDYLTGAGTRFEYIKKTEILPGDIKSAMDYLSSLKYSHNVLFHYYCDLIGVTEKSFMLYYEMKWRKGIPVVNGVAADEKLLEKYVWKLRSLPADQLISILFHYGDKNNSAYETGFLVPTILSRMPEDTYLINPSPYIVQDTIGRCKGYIVWDKYYQKAYSKRFKGDRFLPYNELDSLDKATRVVAILSDQEDVNALKKTIQLLSCKEVVVSIPNTLFNKYKESLIYTTKEAGLNVQGIILIEPAIFTSSPKKNMVLFFSKEKAGQEIPVRILSLENTEMIIGEDQYTIPYDYFRTGRMTIREVSRLYEKPREIKQRNRPIEYYFSNEIRIQVKYRNYGSKKNAIVSYSSISDKAGKSRKISRNIEKGLQYTDKEELERKLNQALFLDELSEIIIEDVKQFYFDRYETLSLKTLWYLYRNKLLEKCDAYDDEFCKQMFTNNSNQNNPLSDIKYNDIPVGTKAQEKIIDDINTDDEKRCIVQLYNLINCLIQDKIFRVNPFQEMMAALSNRMSEEQMEVRNALTKKNMSIGEQRLLLSASEKEETWWLSEGLKALVAGLRLLSGIPVREMLALLWSDMVENVDYGFYQMKVTKMIDGSGEHIIYGMQDDWNRFRIIPLVPELTKMLFRRKRQLMKKYNLTEDKMANIPIFCEDYNERKEPKLIKYEKINKICKQAIKGLDIPKFEILLPGDKELITDLNRYYSDIFLSNFRFHTNHTSLMTRGEINYLLGIKQEDTYAKHYCDYTNDAIQFRMLLKLMRWSTILKTNYDGTLESREAFVNCAEYRIYAKEATTLRIRIHSRFGQNIRLRRMRKTREGSYEE